mmetsp:Transcript_36175/g.64731  ORF Transcript_36175/g.64731 Transcript_36175/m.64731 type:complete len:144 (-) Transcript_36175:231-662(-)
MTEKTMLTKQEKTALAMAENIEAKSYVRQHGLGKWAYEVFRGVGRHPWPRYFELTDFFGDKRHGDAIPRNLAAFKKMRSVDKMAPFVFLGLLTYIYGGAYYAKNHTTLWCQPIEDEYGHAQAYTKEFRAQFDGVNKPKLPQIY